MAKTRDNYYVTGNSVPELVNSLNFLLQRLQDRIDKIEGIRGTATIESTLDMNGNKIDDIADAEDDDEALAKGQVATLSALNIDTDLTVGDDLTVGGDASVSGSVSAVGVASTGAVTYTDSNGTVLHAFGE